MHLLYIKEKILDWSSPIVPSPNDQSSIFFDTIVASIIFEISRSWGLTHEHIDDQIWKILKCFSGGFCRAQNSTVRRKTTCYLFLKNLFIKIFR